MPRLSFKMILIGDTAVGKSSIMLQLLEQEFDPLIRMTIGLEYGCRPMTIRDKDVNLEMWDTAGQESYRSLTQQYYRGADASMIVFDLTRRKSFEHVSRWLADSRTYCNNPHLVVALVGSKADLEQQREVSREEAQRLADKEGLLYRELSAKDTAAVDEVFRAACERMFDSIELAGGQLLHGISLDDSGRIRLNSRTAFGSSAGGSHRDCCPQN